METRIRWVLLCGVLCVPGCSAATLDEGRRGAATAAQRDVASAAILDLQRAQFERAEGLATEGIAADAANPYPRLVRAIARYERISEELATDSLTLVMGGVGAGAINEKYLRQTFGDAERELLGVEADLAAASARSGIGLELCLACWEVDWNRDGRVDDRDRRLLEIEQDADGHPIPEGDPRRRPTFRFDDGDVAWARAFVSFERALLDLVLAYDWTAAGRLGRHGTDRVVIRLIDPDRVAQARQRVLDGLDHSDSARRAYLAETDDDREWVPSPTQRSHPLPLRVDPALYDTWAGVLSDLRRLVRSEEGLRVKDVFTLAGEPDRRAPAGFIDVGRLLSHPRDIAIDRRDLDERNAGEALTRLLGDAYVPAMTPSPLPGRLLRMKGEVDRHEEGLGRKLRYLLWLN